MFKIPVISNVVTFSLIYCRALSKSTALTFQTKTNQLFKLLISLDIRDETRFEPNHLKTFYLNKIEPKNYETIMNGIGQENFPLLHFSQINQNRLSLKGLIADESRQRRSN